MEKQRYGNWGEVVNRAAIQINEEVVEMKGVACAGGTTQSPNKKRGWGYYHLHNLLFFWPLLLWDCGRCPHNCPHLVSLRHS